MPGQSADIFDGLHGLICGSCGIKNNEHQCGIVCVKGISELIRQHFHRKTDVSHAVVPDDFGDVVDLFNFFLQCGYILIFHAFADKHGIGACAEFIHQNILAFHCLDFSRQIGEDIVIHAGVQISDGCRNQQQKTDDKNRNAVFDYFSA